MQVNTKNQAIATYNGLKDAIRSASADNNAIAREGESYSINDNVAIDFDGKSYTVAKDSRFDDDLKTPDKITVREQGSESSGVLGRQAATTTFEHSGRKKFFLFQGEQLTVSGVQKQEIPGGWVGGSYTYEYKY